MTSHQAADSSRFVFDLRVGTSDCRNNLASIASSLSDISSGVAWRPRDPRLNQLSYSQLSGHFAKSREILDSVVFSLKWMTSLLMYVLVVHPNHIIGDVLKRNQFQSELHWRVVLCIAYVYEISSCECRHRLACSWTTDLLCPCSRPQIGPMS